MQGFRPLLVANVAPRATGATVRQGPWQARLAASNRLPVNRTRAFHGRKKSPHIMRAWSPVHRAGGDWGQPRSVRLYFTTCSSTPTKRTN
jgi:hypothetical protein